MKKIVVIILVFLCLGLTYWMYTSLAKKAFQSKNPIEVVPLNAAIIFESNNMRAAWSRLAETNLVYDAALDNEDFLQLDGLIHEVDSTLNSDPLTSNLIDGKSTVFSLHNGDGPQWFAATNGNESSFNAVKSLLEKYGYGIKKSLSGKDVFQFSSASKNIFLAHIPPFIVITSEANLIANGIVQLEQKNSLLKDSLFVSLRKSHNSNIGLQMYVNGARLGELLSPYLTKQAAELWQAGKVIPQWIATDWNEKSNSLIINGLSDAKKSNAAMINVLNQAPQSSRSLWLLPTDLLSFERFSISNPLNFLETNNIANIENISSSCDCDPMGSFADWISQEVITITFGNEHKNSDYATLIGCVGYPNLAGKLTSFGVSDTIFKTVYDAPIYKVRDAYFLKLLGVNDTTSTGLYYARINDFAVFSSFNGVSKIAYQWKISQASVPTNNFIQFAQKLMANFSSADAYYNWSDATEKLARFFKPEYQEVVKKTGNELASINGVIWQASSTKNNRVYHSFAINTNQGNKQVGAAQELWSLALQNNILGSPQVMKNHVTNTNELVVQDDKFNLHLIGATGKVKWFKPLNEPIIGDIQQIDLFKNGKYQMLFNTASRIHLLDVNGNQVSGFPIKLPSNATNPLSVFDYENTGDYRILVATIDKKILNYGKNGLPITGWNVAATQQILVNPIAYFTVENKDYLCANDLQGKVYLYNRKGEMREPVSNVIDTKFKESLFLQNGTTLSTTKFIYTDSLDRLTEMPLIGNKKQTKLDSTSYDIFQYTVDLNNDKLPSFITAFVNKLSVYGADKTLIYQELYGFDIHRNVASVGEGNKYTIVGDDQSGKIYLFNHQFKPVQGFPQKGTIKATVGDLNKDGNQELITILGGKQIVVYTINPSFGL